ncbi:pilin [Metasolibacillus sp.]|uniref:pilin n=1 Tax=Metasolibacillus sp. TaxID=2703680 RepID=UPI0025E08546|nr:pilin [Metasolibacillus sp.]MCT6922803.1 pilin [Metasolibacillus sp.]MCT6938858.1 pilin [Metasolibacillus sp.]
MQETATLINSIAKDVQSLAPAVAGIALVIIGLVWMFAKDPNKKEGAQQWLTNVGIGFMIVYLAATLVAWGTAKVAGLGGFS